MRRLVEILLIHRGTLDRLLILAGVILSMGAVAMAAIVYRRDWPTQRFLIIYMAPLFAFGAAWGRSRLRTLPSNPPSLFCLDVIAFVAGGLRAGGGWGVLPYSGHMLFLTYVVLAARQGTFRWFALALAAMTTWFKLAAWHDWQTWTLGLVAGVALAVTQQIVVRRASPAHTG